MSDRWNIPKQTLLVEDGKVGDCWRCCVAAVLNIPAESVPHFVELSKQSGSCDADTQAWLNERGFMLIHAEGERTMGFPRWHGRAFPAIAKISCGPTQRSRGLGKHHAVVFVDGDMVYDPHPSNAGLTAIVEQYLILPIPEDSIK